MSAKDTIDCRMFQTLGDLRQGYGTNNVDADGSVCNGCPHMQYSGGMLTCNFLKNAFPIEGDEF